ncbi:MAG: hemerythrin domain-containing protein [Azoarcus sp.]|jgi:hemerythrin-like metal-binding protein|nr:hemerythrin domain-containing protein [Azoarcus sp.]
MDWGERYEQGIARMDETHREFVEHYNTLAAAEPGNFLACFDAFIAHTEAHFDQENRWMDVLDFPPCHRGEHDRVLDVMREVRRRVEQGDAFLGRRLLEELHPWFDHHVDTMDAALAFYLKETGFDPDTCMGKTAHAPGDAAHLAGGDR